MGDKFIASMKPLAENAIGFFINVGEAVVDLIKDGVKITLTLVNGIADFANCLVKGDIQGAFAALDKGFTEAASIAINRLTKIGEGIWAGMKAIGNFAVKVWKFITTVDPKLWIVLAVSIVIGIAMSLVFPPLGVALLGVTGGLATAVTVTAEVAIVLVDMFLINPALEKGIVGDSDRPETLDADGVTLKYDHSRSEYCYAQDSVYSCFNEGAGQFCLIEKDIPAICAEREGAVYMTVNGTKTIFDDSLNQWNPPVKHRTFEGVSHIYDEQRKQYCHMEGVDRFCYDSINELNCKVKAGAPDECINLTTMKGWYKKVNNQILFEDPVTGEWIPEKDFDAKYPKATEKKS